MVYYYLYIFDFITILSLQFNFCRNENTTLLSVFGEAVGRNGFDFLYPSKSLIPTPKILQGGNTSQTANNYEIDK